MRRIFIILCWPLMSLADVIDLCPSSEDIVPCMCVSDGKNYRIDCIQLKSVEELKAALSGLKGFRNLNVDLLLCQLGVVPSDIFRGLHIEKLSFTNCKLQALGDGKEPPLSGLENSLQELTVTFSFLEELDLSALSLSHLRSLEQLEVEGNTIRRLGNDWLQKGPSSIQNLFLMYNLIEVLEDTAFASLRNIRNLWLTGNSFSTLARSMFPQPANYLASLDLSDNKISSLPEDIFIDMPSLKEVILDTNYLKQLPEETWSLVWTQLTRVYVIENPIQCDSHLRWLYQVRLPHVLRGTCSSPPRLRGLELKHLTGNDLDLLQTKREIAK